MSSRAIYKLDSSEKAREVLSLLDTVHSNKKGRETITKVLEGSGITSADSFATDEDGDIQAGTYLIKLNHNDCLSALARKFGLGDAYGQELYRQNKDNNFVKTADLIIEGGYLVFTVDEEPVDAVVAASENNPAIESENNGTAIQNTPQYTTQNGTAFGATTSHSGQAKAGGVDAYSQEVFERVAEYSRESIARREGLEEKEIQESKEGQAAQEEIPQVIAASNNSPNNPVQTVGAFAPGGLVTAAFLNELSHTHVTTGRYPVHHPVGYGPPVMDERVVGIRNRMGFVTLKKTTAPGFDRGYAFEVGAGPSWGGVSGQMTVVGDNVIVKGDVVGGPKVSRFKDAFGDVIVAGSGNNAGKAVERQILDELRIVPETVAHRGFGTGGLAVKILPEHTAEMRRLEAAEGFERAVKFLVDTGKYPHLDAELLKLVASGTLASVTWGVAFEAGVYYLVSESLPEGMRGKDEAALSASVAAGQGASYGTIRLTKIAAALAELPFFLGTKSFITDPFIDNMVANCNENPDSCWGVRTLLGTQEVGDDPFRRVVTKWGTAIPVYARARSYATPMLEGARTLLSAGRESLPSTPRALVDIGESVLNWGVQGAQNGVDRAIAFAANDVPAYMARGAAWVAEAPVVKPALAYAEPVIVGAKSLGAVALTQAKSMGASALKAGFEKFVAPGMGLLAKALPYASAAKSALVAATPEWLPVAAGEVFTAATSAPAAAALFVSSKYQEQIREFEKAEKPAVRQRLEPSMEVLAHTWGSRTTEINSKKLSSLSASEMRGLTKLADTFNNALWWQVDNIWGNNTPDFKALYTVLEDADVKAVVSKYPEDIYNEIIRFMLDYCYATDAGTIDTPSDWEGNIKRYDEYGADLLAYMDTIMGMKDSGKVNEEPVILASVIEPVEYPQSFEEEDVFETCPVHDTDYLASSSDYQSSSY